MHQDRPTTVVYIATSIDGFISRQNGSFDWLTPFEDPGAFKGFESFLATIEAIVMGRNTFLQVIDFDHWPYGNLPVYVLSSSMKQLPANSRDTVHLRNSTPQELLMELGTLNVSRVYVDGGITIANFLAVDLIDELTITRVPILIGSGRTLFGPVPSDLMYQHVSTEAFASGRIQSRYIRIRKVAAP